MSKKITENDIKILADQKKRVNDVVAKIKQDTAYDEIKSKLKKEGQSEEEASEGAGKILSAAKGKKGEKKEEPKTEVKEKEEWKEKKKEKIKQLTQESILIREGFPDLEHQLERNTTTQENRNFAIKTYIRPLLITINNQKQFNNTPEETQLFNKDRKELEILINKYLPDNIKLNAETEIITIPGNQSKETEKAIQWETENYLFWFPKSWVKSKSKTELKIPEDRLWDKLKS